MTTLSRRATPAQARILRIIEGAVLNEADAHGRPRNEYMARSIAKRATGTLSVEWPIVLAANTRLSELRRVSTTKCRACERRAQMVRRLARKQFALVNDGDAAERRPTITRRPPLIELWLRIKRELWHLKKLGRMAEFQARVDLLRMIDRLQQEICG